MARVTVDHSRLNIVLFSEKYCFFLKNSKGWDKSNFHSLLLNAKRLFVATTVTQPI